MRLPSVPIRIIAVAGVLAVALVGLVVREGVARAQGQEVRLAVGGYDPRSLLSGHYVQFQLSDRLPAETACRWKGRRLEQLPGGWLAVRREGAGHRIVGMAETRAAALRQGEMAMRGKVTCIGAAWTPPGGTRQESSLSASLDIGIDRIHLAQDEALRIENALRTTLRPEDAQVILSVGADGKPRLRGVIVGGERTELGWF